MNQFISFALPVFLMILAVWRRTWIFYVMAGFAWLLFGFDYVAIDKYMATILIVIGLFCFGGALWDKR